MATPKNRKSYKYGSKKRICFNRAKRSPYTGKPAGGKEPGSSPCNQQKAPRDLAALGVAPLRCGGVAPLRCGLCSRVGAPRRTRRCSRQPRHSVATRTSTSWP